MPNFAKVILKLTKNGLPRGVIIDGVEVKNVSNASIDLMPGNVTKLNLSIHVAEVKTEVGGDAVKESPSAIHGV